MSDGDEVKKRAHEFAEGWKWGKQRMEKDPGFRRSVETYAKELAYRQRYKLCREAVEAARRDRDTIERKLALGQGVWWDELAPLMPTERSIVIAELKKLWDIRETLN